MALPFLPPGQTDLPAERFIVWADDTNLVLRVDEAEVQKDGVSFTSEWQSGTLNPIREGFVFELTRIEFIYAATGITTASISASGDGGENWSAPQTLNFVLTPGQIPRAVVDFGVTGFDLRFRIQLDTDVIVNIFGYRPHLVDRGDLAF